MPRGSNLISARQLHHILADLQIVARTGNATPSPFLAPPTPTNASPFLLFDATVGGADAFYTRRIPGALYFDLNLCADVTSGLKRTKPKKSVFQDYLQTIVAGRKWEVDASGDASANNDLIDVDQDSSADNDFSANNDFDVNNNSSHDKRKLAERLHPFIDDTTQIVAYDCFSGFGGLRSAPRLWWLFKLFGHHKVSVLDGGFDAWIKEG